MANSDSTAGGNRSAQILLLSEKDHVCVAIKPLAAGSTLEVNGRRVVIDRGVAIGAKIAIRPIAAGETIYKYGSPIGSATRDIAPGQHVHTHNLKSDYLPTKDRGEHETPSA